MVGIKRKPTSSIRLEGKTIDNKGNDAKVITKGRHDPCVGIRAEMLGCIVFVMLKWPRS